MTNWTNQQQEGVRIDNQSAELVLALALCDKPAEGVCPSLEEIVSWQEHKLSGELKDRVTSHVARCDRCHHVWTNLVSALNVIAEHDQHSITALPARYKWTQYLLPLRKLILMRNTSYAAALVGALTIFLMIFNQPSLDEMIDMGYMSLADANINIAVPEKWVWQIGIPLRGFDTAMSQHKETEQTGINKTAFQSGMRNGLEKIVDITPFWRTVLENLPSEPVNCGSKELESSCKDANTAFHATGRWSVLLHFACDRTQTKDTETMLDNPIDKTFWKEQVVVMHQLGTFFSENTPSSEFDRFFYEWKRETEDSSDVRGALCARETTLLTLGVR